MPNLLLCLLCSLLLVTQAHAKTVLRLGMYHSPPYYFTENVIEPHGLSVDLLRPAARQLGIGIEIVVCPFARCLKMAQSGEIDIVAGLIKTPEREQFLHFLQPAMMNFLSSFAIYSRQEQPFIIKDISDLQGHSVAVMREAAYFPEFDNAASINKIAVSSEAVSLDMVHKGRVQFAITVEQTAAGSFLAAGLQQSDLKRQPYHYEQNIRGYLAFSRQSPNYAIVQQLEPLLHQQYKAGLFHLLWQKYRLPAIRNQVRERDTTVLQTASNATAPH
jgi:polar amino acid transport system substrate-binding protein